MAYYDPYNSDDRYYDPHQNTAGGSAIGAVRSLVGNFAKNAVGYMVMYGAMSLAGAAASKVLGKGIQGAGLIGGSAGNRISALSNPTLGGIAKSFTPVRKILATSKKAIRPYRNAYKKRARNLTNLSKSDPLAADRARLTSVFKDGKTAVAATGNMLYKYGIKGSMAGYAWDSVSGNLPSYGLENKSWWNIPGHLMNYGKYMKDNIVSFSAFGAFAPAYKGARGVIGTTARGFFDKNVGFTNKVVENLSKITRPRYSSIQMPSDATRNVFKRDVNNFNFNNSDNIFNKIVDTTKTSVATFYDSMVVEARTFFTQAGKHGTHNTSTNIHRPTKSGANNFLKKFKDSFSNNWEKNRKAARYGKETGVMGSHGMQTMKTFEHIGNVQSASVLDQGGQTGVLNELIPNDQIKPKNLIAQVLGFRHTTVGDTMTSDYISRVAGGLAKYYPKNTHTEIMSSLSSIRMGSNYYSKGKFNVDLSMFSPIHQAKRLTNKIMGVNLSFMFGLPPAGRSLTLGNITGWNSIAGGDVKSTFFNKDTHGTKLIVKSGGVTDSRGLHVQRGTPRTLHQLAADTLGEGYADNLNIAMVNGKFYAADGVNLTNLNSMHTTLPFSHPAIFGKAGEAKVSSGKEWLYHSARGADAIVNAAKWQREAERNLSSNPFQWALKKLDWKMPEPIRNSWERIKHALVPGRIIHTGKQIDHTQDLHAAMWEGMFGKNITADQLKAHLPIMNDAREHLGQEVGMLMRSKTIFQSIANKSKGLLEEYSGHPERFHDDQIFMNRLYEMGEYTLPGEKSIYNNMMGNPNIRGIYETALYSPAKARQSVPFRRMGRLSDYNAMQILKTQRVMSSINLRGPDELNPLVSAADELFKNREISGTQRTSMKLFAFVETLFNEESIRKFSSGAGNPSELTAINSVANKFKTDHNISLQHVIDYVADTQYRSPTKPGGDYMKKLAENIQDPNLLKSIYDKTNDTSPFFAISTDDASTGSIFKAGVVKALDIGAERLTNLISTTTGFRRDPFKYGNGVRGATRFITTRAAQMGAAVLGFKALDAIIADNTTFNETSLDQGITGFIADNVAKTHLLSSRIANMTGIAGVGRYLDGLMPGFDSSAPGAIVGSALNWRAGAFNMMIGAAKGAIANRVLSPLMPDFTKTYEQLEAEYAGREEVPIIDGKMWFMGTTPWQGKTVKGWRPNWYQRLTSRWKTSDSLYGSEFRKLLHEPIFPVGISIGDIIDPYYMERKHYFSRPYPETGDFGADIPMGIGAVVGATLGRIIKPKKQMHREFMEGDNNVGENDVSAISPPTYKESRGMMHTRTWGKDSIGGRTSFMGTARYGGTPKYGQRIADSFLDNFESALGLVGFAGHTVRMGLTSDPVIVPTVETAGRIASQSRAYYDMNLGGLGIYCLPYDGKVLTPKGLVNICDIHEGDIVYDKDYIERGVTNTFKRICSKKEKMYRFTLNAGKTNIDCTWNHPIAVYRKEQCHDNKNRPCIPNSKKHCNVCTKENKDISWSWIPAEDIKIGDYAVMPLPKHDVNVEIIDLSDYSDYNYSSEYIYTRASQGYITSLEMLENNPNLTRKQLREYVDDKDAKEALSSIRRNKIPTRYNRYLNITHNVAWFIGWWLAEGSSNVSNGEIRFSLNINEVHIAKVLGKIYTESFGGKFKIYEYPDRTLCVLVLKNKVLASYLHSFGNVYNKSMNLLVNLSDNKLRALIDGIIQGDGWLNNKLQRGGFKSVSSKLVRDVWLSLFRLGIQSSITIDYLEKSNGRILNGKVRKDHIRSELQMSKNGYNNYCDIILNNKKHKDVSTGRVFTNNGNLYIKITDISSVSCGGTTVYDIEVEESHCFIGNYLLLHNSEVIRRFVEKPDWRAYGVNPIPNLMPNWLPSKFTKGDPFVKISNGELRLPGPAYERTHSGVNREMPGRACFTPDTLIDTSYGLEYIIDAKDTLTHDGTYQLITKRHETEYNGILLNIKLDGIDDKYNINVTPNHDIFAIKTNKCKYYKTQSKYRRTCFKCNDKRKEICNKNDMYNVGEYKAVDLEMGDYLITPIPKVTHVNNQYDLYELLKPLNKYKLCNGELYNGNNVKVKRFIDITPELMRLIGFYIAEGSLSKYQTTFTFHSNESEYHSFIVNTSTRLFGGTSKINTKGNATNVVVSNTLMRDTLYMLCDTVKNKHLPYNIYDIGYDNIKALLNGYICGDGWVLDNEVGSVSCIESLSFSIFRLLCSLEYRPSISYRTGKNVFFKKEERHIQSTKRIDVRMYGAQARHAANVLGFNDDYISFDNIISNGYIPYKIKEIKSKQYKGKVYDLSVANNHNYCVPIALVHNSMLGAPTEHSVQYFTGTLPAQDKEMYDILDKGTRFHENIQQFLAAEGLLIQAEALVYDVKNDISGHVDAIVKDGIGGKGRKALEIKTISDEGLKLLDGPKWQHVGQINFYLDQLKLKKGGILYVSRDNPSNFKMFDVNFSPNRLDKDLERLHNARSIAAQMLAKSQEGDGFGYSYSWLDRLYILADVAPNSSEYKEAKSIVEKQIKAGMIDPKGIEKYHRAQRHKDAVVRKYELYPLRFKGRVMSPDSEYNRQSINDNIKAGAEYSLPERAIGAAWETFTNTNTFLVNKFFAFKDPLEHYKQYQLYGQEYTPWTDPYGSFIRPQIRTMMSQENPVSAALNWGIGLPYMLGGRAGGIYGAVAGGIYGAVHAAVRKVTPTAYTPSAVNKERQINEYFDELKYARNMRMAALSEGNNRTEFANQARSTLTSILSQGGMYGDMFRAVPNQERPYLAGWLNETNPERRDEIARFLPERMSHAMRTFWHSTDNKMSTKEFLDNTSADMASGRKTMPYDMSVLDPSVNLEDIKLKQIQQQGLNVHDFGLGWQEQMLRTQNQIDRIPDVDIYDNRIETPSVNTASIKAGIYDLFKSAGIKGRVNVFINNHSDGENKVTLIVQRDRLITLKRSLDNRSRWIDA